MIRTLLALFRPLTTIAREIRIIRELYEEELSRRDPPIYRVTEKPSKDDTEVSYAGIDRKKSRWAGDEDDEDYGV